VEMFYVFYVLMRRYTLLADSGTSIVK